MTGPGLMGIIRKASQVGTECQRCGHRIARGYRHLSCYEHKNKHCSSCLKCRELYHPHKVDGRWVISEVR